MCQRPSHKRSCDAAHDERRLPHSKRSSQVLRIRTDGDDRHRRCDEAIRESHKGTSRCHLPGILRQPAEKVGKAEQHRRADRHLLLAPRIRQLSPDRPHDARHQKAAREYDARPKCNTLLRYPDIQKIERQERNDHRVADRYKEHARNKDHDILSVLRGWSSPF